MYIYLDETVFGNDNQYCGYGSFSSQQRISEFVISGALQNLEDDKDRHKKKFRKQDDRTLARKYFHACDDSQNGHSHLCTAISDNVSGVFNSNFFDTSKGRIRSSNSAYDLSAKLSAVNDLQDSHEVTFIFENRNDLNLYSLNNWWKKFQLELLKSQYKLPFLRCYFPDVKFEISNKSEPGLQIVDFILWASSRVYSKPKCKWFNNVTQGRRADLKDVSDEWLGHSLYIGDVDEEECFYALTDYAPDDTSLNSSDLFPEYILHVQQVINKVKNDISKINVSHFWDEVLFLNQSSLTPGNAEHIKKMAVCYLKLFDNIGIVNKNTTQDEKRFLLFCRNLMASTMHMDELQNVRIAQHLSKARNALIEKYPEKLR